MYYIIEIFEDFNKNKLHILSSEHEFLHFEFDKDIKKSIGSTHLPIDNFIISFDLFFTDKTDDKNLIYCLSLLNSFKDDDVNSIFRSFYKNHRFHLQQIFIKEN